MPDTTAKIRLKAMTAWATEPVLSEGEIDALLVQYRTADADGYVFGDAAYVETYNLRAAAKEGWMWKAGRCTDQVSSDLDGDRLSANQLFDHCQTMIRKYSGTPTMNLGQGANLVNTLEETFESLESQHP